LFAVYNTELATSSTLSCCVQLLDLKQHFFVVVVVVVAVSV